MTSAESVQALAELLAKDERVAAGIVFGSVAKHLDRASSDIDLAVVGRSDDAAASLHADLLRLVGELSIATRRSVHLVVLESAGSTLGFQAFRHGQVLFDRHPERTAKIRERVLLAYFDSEHHRRVLRESVGARLGAPHG